MQKQAIDELEALPVDRPFRQAALELLYNLQQHLRTAKDLETGDQELIMRLAPLYQQERDRLQLEAKQEGRQEGKQEGRQEGISLTKRGIALNLLRMGMAIAPVSEATGLTLEQVTQLCDESSASQ